MGGRSPFSPAGQLPAAAAAYWAFTLIRSVLSQLGRVTVAPSPRIRTNCADNPAARAAISAAQKDLLMRRPALTASHPGEKSD